MKTLNSKGEEVVVFLETSREGSDRYVVWSELKEPTEEDIRKFKVTPCDHKHQKETLIYDVYGFTHDFRFCAVCDRYLGTV